jgi:predicted nucleic acid-binding protein
VKRERRGRRVARTVAFWDASGLVPLCVDQLTSARANAHFRNFTPVVWWGTPVEVHSAICRLHRERQLSDVDKNYALSRLQFLSSSWREVLPSDQVRATASRVLERHPLWAADAVQLAASLVWCNQRPSGRTFVSGDLRLAAEAESAGFTVLTLN